MMMSHAPILLLALAVGVSGSQAPQIPHLALAISIDCSHVPIKFCSLDVGCDIYKDTCRPASKPPPFNCTLALATSGGAVTDAAKELRDNLKALNEISYMSMKNTSKSLDTLTDASSKYDSNMKKYNDSLTAFTNSESVLASLNDQLAALQQTCSMTDPPPPPTCPVDIEKLEEKIASQNATCSMMWIKVDSAKKFLDLSAGLVNDAETALDTVITKSAETYASMKGMVEGFMKDKSQALAFWEAVKNACVGVPPVMLESHPEEKVASASVPPRSHKPVHSIA